MQHKIACWGWIAKMLVDAENCISILFLSFNFKRNYHTRIHSGFIRRWERKRGEDEWKFKSTLYVEVMLKIKMLRDVNLQ